MELDFSVYRFQLIIRVFKFGYVCDPGVYIA